MDYPEELFYSKSHVWVKFEDGTTASVGITDYEQEELGRLVAVNLPEEGDVLDFGDVFADVESEEASEDIISPFSGTISEVNSDLLDSPDMINAEPYEAWIAVFTDISDRDDLMDSEEYAAFVEKENE
ncbi:MAG: glycine cleavage system protein GcvH [Eubacteriaceae bacterium]|jgi:glycine cleavage system H protein|nr:glycine cleavage system protein GcvH [Eubacteriaceae bacterium]